MFRPEYATYDFGPQHPLRPERLTTSFALFTTAGLAPTAQERLAPAAATLDELQLVHSRRYIEAVQMLDGDAEHHGLADEAIRWGLGWGDTPAFTGMHAASAAIAGGTLHAVRGVLDGSFDHAFNPAGGLHHAMPERASGFCIYNDPAIGIAGALEAGAARVLYLDFDAHHGDGVQAAFYGDPRVLTFSIHESGRHLFPGTGFVHELGEGRGHGYSLNLPVEPFTDDAAWLGAVELVVPRIAESFRPDVIVSQHGCDSHAWDPLTHLHLSTRAYAAQARLVHELTHRLTGGRWVATGGGGYDWVRVVPRSWSFVWAEMSGRAVPEELPVDWLERWSSVAKAQGFWPLPRHFLDEEWSGVSSQRSVVELRAEELLQHFVASSAEAQLTTDP